MRVACGRWQVAMAQPPSAAAERPLPRTAPRIRCQPSRCRNGVVALATAIESVGQLRPEVEEALEAALDNCLTDTDLGMGKKYTASLPSAERRPPA